MYSRATGTLDLSATYAFPNDAITFTIGGKNVFNERFVVNGTNQLAGAGVLFATYNNPAEWYAALRFKM